MHLSLLHPDDALVPPQPKAADGVDANWVTLGVLAIAIACVDGFVVTSLHGAVGDVASNQTPFLRWLRDSTMMLPPLVLSLLAALALSTRWFRRSRGELVRLALTAVLIIGISTAVSIAEVAVNAASDYTTQANELEHVHGIHSTTTAGQLGIAESTGTSDCTGLCAARQATLMAHVRGIAYSSAVLLLANIVLVAWVLALRGGRLWARQATTSGE